MDMVSAHLEWMALSGLAERTQYARAGTLARLAAYIAPVPLEDATQADLMPWRASLARWSDITIICNVRHASAFYGWLRDEARYRPDHPARRVPVPGQPEYLPRPIGQDALFHALDTATGRVWWWLVFGAFQGLRACEIGRLRRKYLLEHAATPHVYVAADATKGHRPRVVELHPFVLSAVLAGAEGGLPAKEWCWPRLDGQAGHVPAHTVSTECCEHLHSLGYADTLHSLRHYFLSQARHGGADLRVVQRLAGHRSMSTTALYEAVESEEAAAAVARIPAPRRLRRAV
jgi:integrase